MCSGKGFCNYDESPPQCVCYDKADTSPGCYGVGTQYELNIDYPMKDHSIDPNSGMKHASIFNSIFSAILLFML